jgi:hypothetical protein
MRNLRNGIFATAVTIAVTGLMSPVDAQPYGGGGYGPGYGMMGGGYGQGYGPGSMMGPGYGPGMMGGGYGPGMMGGGYGPGWGGGGPGWMMRGYGGGYRPGPGMMYGYGPSNQGNLNLGVDQVKQYFERMIRNPNLKVGDVKEKDADTIVAEIVTKQGNSLVQRLDVNRHNGFIQPEQ